MGQKFGGFKFLWDKNVGGHIFWRFKKNWDTNKTIVDSKIMNMKAI